MNLKVSPGEWKELTTGNQTPLRLTFGLYFTPVSPAWTWNNNDSKICRRCTMCLVPFKCFACNGTLRTLRWGEFYSLYFEDGKTEAQRATMPCQVQTARRDCSLRRHTQPQGLCRSPLDWAALEPWKGSLHEHTRTIQQKSGQSACRVSP